MYRRSCIEGLEHRVLLANDIPIRDIQGDRVATIPWQGQQVDVFAGQWILKLDGFSGYLLNQQRDAQLLMSRTDAAFTVDRHLGGDGVFLASADGTRALLPALPVEVVCGLGAGDAFGGALCHGLIAGWDPVRTVRFANAAGAIVASRLLCAPAMPTADEVLALQISSERPRHLTRTERK